jgi:localization factor PodJL
MHNLGVLIVGKGQEPGDYAVAVQWFRRAAMRGYIDSQFNLATLYASGRGVPKDLTESYKWFALAARAGDAGAARRLEEIKSQLDLPEQEAAERQVAAWRPEAPEPIAAGQTSQ